jgi:hypothetical protein
MEEVRCDYFLALLNYYYQRDWQNQDHEDGHCEDDDDAAALLYYGENVLLVEYFHLDYCQSGS